MAVSTALYVSPDPTVAKQVTDRISDAFQVSVKQATDHQGAQEILTEETPDCVISRAKLPTGDGVALLSEAQLQLPGTQTVLFPKDGDEALASEAVQAGVDGYVPSDDVTALLDRLEDILEEEEDRVSHPAQRYRALFERSDDALAWVEFTDAGAVIRDANDRFVETFGPDRETVIGADIDTVVAANSRDKARALTEQVADGTSLSRTLTRKTVDGLRRFRWQAVPVSEPSTGAVRYAFTIYTDITDQEEQLERFQAFVEDSPSILTVITPGGEITYQSPSIERILGYPPPEMLGSDIYTYIHPDDHTLVRAFLSRVQEEGGPHTVEYRLRDAEGNWRWIESRSSGRPESPVVDDIVINSRDITERRNREQDLQNARAFTQSLLAALPDVFFAITDDQRLLRWNDELASVVGHEDFEGLRFRTLLDATDRGAFDEAVVSVTDTAEAVTIDAALENGQNRDVPYRFTLAPVSTGEEESIIVGIGRDISDRLARERQLQVTNRILRHNVRNRLNIIKGLLGSLKEEYPETQCDVAEIQAMTDRLLQNANNARSINEFVRSGPTTEAKPLKPTLTRAAQTVQTRHPDAEIVLDDINPVAVDVVSIFEETMVELLENAIVHNDAATPRVQVSTAISDQVVEVTISDNGPGLDSIDCQILTGDVDLDSITHGSGIGLWQIYWTVQYSDGSITVPDTEEGTTIRLRLPRPAQPLSTDVSAQSHTVD